MVDRPIHLKNVDSLFALAVDTDELFPMFKRGGRILVHPNRPLVLDEPCVVITDEGKALLKIYRGRTQLGHLLNTIKTPEIVTFPDQAGQQILKVLTYDDLLG